MINVKKILIEGIGVNSIGGNGMTALMAVKDGKNKNIVEFLLSMGAKDDSEIKKESK